MTIKPMLLALALTLLQDAGAWDIAGPASASRLAGSSVSFTALPLGTTDIRLYLINATGSYSAHDAQVQSATCAADFRAGARDAATCTAHQAAHSIIFAAHPKNALMPAATAVAR